MCVYFGSNACLCLFVCFSYVCFFSTPSFLEKNFNLFQGNFQIIVLKPMGLWFYFQNCFWFYFQNCSLGDRGLEVSNSILWSGHNKESLVHISDEIGNMFTKKSKWGLSRISLLIGSGEKWIDFHQEILCIPHNSVHRLLTKSGLQGQFLVYLTIGS